MYKWGLKFRGAHNESLSAFLQSVDELCVARNVSQAQLMRSALDLFEGRAKQWYRSIRKSVNSWVELVSALKEEYQPHDYEEKLLEEIKNRTQEERE